VHCADAQGQTGEVQTPPVALISLREIWGNADVSEKHTSPSSGLKIDLFRTLPPHHILLRSILISSRLCSALRAVKPELCAHLSSARTASQPRRTRPAGSSSPVPTGSDFNPRATTASCPPMSFLTARYKQIFNATFIKTGIKTKQKRCQALRGRSVRP
jgi:hypothetical protein